MSSEADSKKTDEQKKLQASVTRFSSRINAVKEIVDKCLEKDLYTSASTEERVKYDLFLAFATTSLYWAYLRSSGIDPHNNPIKHEVERVRSYMAKAKTVHDRHLRPKVNQEASKRFVKHALWTAPESETNQKSNVPRKRKFDDDGNLI